MIIRKLCTQMIALISTPQTRNTNCNTANGFDPGIWHKPWDLALYRILFRQ